MARVPKDNPKTGNGYVESESLSAESLHAAVEEQTQKEREKRRDDIDDHYSANKGKNLGDILLEADLISAEQLGQAIELQLRQGKRLRDVLAEQEMISTEELATALSIQLNTPLIDLRRHTVQPRAVNLISEETARKHTLIPLDIIDNILYVVMADPTDIYAVEDLQTEAKMGVEPLLGIPEQIEQAIDNQFLDTSNVIEKQLSQYIPYRLEQPKGPIDLESIAKTPIVKTFDIMVSLAIQERASDIHLEPQENRLRIRYRIDGILHDSASLPLSAHAALITRIKVMAGLDIAEQRRPQDGQITVQSGGFLVDIRVATTGTIHGERATLRILGKERSLISLESLGFSKSAYGTYSNLIQSAYGMILVSGPTGAGKTTTLYATISNLDRAAYNILTIEDPVEYKFDNLSQVQVNMKAGITFTSGLRTFLRHDPDVIMVGEIRDGDTARLATQAAMTGHLVFSTVHANDSISTVYRLIDLGVEPYLIASTVIGVVAQRMTRRICPHCRVKYDPTPEEKEVYQAEMGSEEIVFYKGEGCQSCNETGFLGRIGVYEVLNVSDEIRQMLVDNASAGQLKAQALKEGFVSLRHDGMQKVKEGITTPAEVIRTVFSVGQR